MSATLVMALVSGALAVGAIFALTRPVTSGMAVYAQRIIGTMLGAGAIMLAEFAFVMQSSGSEK